MPAVLALSVCAMLGGARSLYAVAPVGTGTPPVSPISGLRPGADAVRGNPASRVRRLDVDAFESASGRWAQDCLGEGEATINIDGRTLRGINGVELPGFRLVAAYPGESGLVLRQTGGSGESQGERTGDGLGPAVPTGTEGKGGYPGCPLLPARDLSLGVLEQGGDYFWMLKDNQLG